MKKILCIVLFIAVSVTSYAQQFAQQEKHEIYASIVSINQAAISSELPNKIKKIYFRPGEKFKKGSVLVSFDCSRILLQIAKARAVLKGTDATLESNKKLYKLQSASDLELKKAESEHEKALAELYLLKNEKAKCNIIAPYNGEVTGLFSNENEIAKSDTPLLYITSNKAIELQMYLPSSRLNKIHVGETFTFYPGELHGVSLTGKIAKIVSKVDEASQSILVIGHLSKTKAPLFSGMSGIVQFNHQVKTT